MEQRRDLEAAPRMVLVPLDGSRRAEQALPYAARFAQAVGGRVQLVAVVEPVPDIPEAEQPHLLEAERWEHYRAYLDRVHAALPAPVRGGAAVETGRAADAIERVAAGAWLVVVASHGRAGLRRWVLGSVTDHLVRELRVPVCVIRPVDEVTPLPAPALRRVVVPLDGSARAEEALPIAVDLARALGISLLLLHVAPRPDETLRVGGEPVVDRWAAVLFEAAAAYLDERRGRLDSGALVVETAVRVGEPAEVILQEVTGGGDLLVMATHGRTGLTRWALGSIADKVVRAGEAPVILVRSRGRGGVLLFRASQPHGTGERRTP